MSDVLRKPTLPQCLHALKLSWLKLNWSFFNPLQICSRDLSKIVNIIVVLFLFCLIRDLRHFQYYSAISRRLFTYAWSLCKPTGARKGALPDGTASWLGIKPRTPGSRSPALTTRPRRITRYLCKVQLLVRVGNIVTKSSAAEAAESVYIWKRVKPSVINWRIVQSLIMLHWYNVSCRCLLLANTLWFV